MGRLDEMRRDLSNRTNELKSVIEEHLRQTSIIQSIQLQEPQLADKIIASTASAGISAITALMNLFYSFGVDSEDKNTQIRILMDIASAYSLPVENEEKLYEEVANLILNNEQAQNRLIMMLKDKDNGTIENK